MVTWFTDQDKLNKWRLKIVEVERQGNHLNEIEENDN